VLAIPVALFGLYLPAATQAQQSLPLWRSTNEPALKGVYSSGHRFLITGPNSLRVARISLVSEDLCVRVERRLKERITLPPGDALRIELRVDGANVQGRILAKQWLQGKRMVQRMRVINMTRADSESFTAVFAGLLLSRIAVSKYGGEDPPVVPTWLAEGLAQHLDEVVRARNHDLVLTMLESGAAPGIAEVVREVEPAEMRQQRHLYGILFAWLYSQSGRSAVLDSLYRTLAAGESPGLDWLARHIAPDGSPEELERKWQKWLVRQHTIIPAYALLTPRVLRKLEAALHLVPLESASVAADASQPVRLHEAIARRHEPWVDVAAWQTIVRIERVGLGYPRELQPVIKSYRAFLEALAKGKRARSLARLLETADASFVDLQQRVLSAEAAPESK